jgi:hypothetical protein
VPSGGAEVGVVPQGLHLGHSRAKPITVPLRMSKGRTRPRFVAEALGMRKGGVFRLESQRVRRLMKLGPFQDVWIRFNGVDDKVGGRLASFF